MNINIPRNAANLILLSQNNLAKHQADGASSVLDHLDMAAMSAIVGIADVKHRLSLQKSRDAETATENRDIALGDHRQGIMIPGTVRFYATSVRDILLGIYKGNERQLGNWSFEVNTDTTVVISRNTAELITLAKGILAKHQADGPSSPLNSLNMADMQAKTNTADQQHSLSKTAERDAEEATQDRDLALGHGANQNSYTPGAVLFFVCSVRDALLSIFRGRERNLGDWGFGVAAGTPAPPLPTTAMILITNQTIPGPVTIGITGNALATGTQQLMIDYGNGSTDMLTILNGAATNATRSYPAPGIYTIRVTPVQPDAFLAVRDIRATEPNKATAITLTGDFSSIISYNLYGNNFNVNDVNAFLIKINGYGASSNGAILDLSGGTSAPPTGQGIAAKQQLISRGWLVVTN